MLKKKLVLYLLCLSLLSCPVQAEEDYIKWVDFDVGYAALQHALDLDIASRDSERPVSWIDLLALAAGSEKLTREEGCQYLTRVGLCAAGQGGVHLPVDIVGSTQAHPGQVLALLIMGELLLSGR